MSRVVVYPYHMGSQSSRRIARHYNGLRVYPDRNYRPRPTDTIINWGSGRIPNWFDRATRILNDPENVNVAGNKLRTLNILRRYESYGNGTIHVPDFTTSSSEALRWLEEGDSIVVRHALRGHSGQGIELLTEPQDVPLAPLYTKYVKKQHEYRVHVFKQPDGTYDVIDMQQKRKRRETPNEEVDYQIRNHQTGWIYAREDVSIPASAQAQCVLAVSVLGLDFGAVDLIYNEHHEKYYVLEVNTAPGLFGDTTFNSYVTEFNKHLGE